MFDVGVHNWCTNKTSPVRHVFFFSSCILTIHLYFLLSADCIWVYLFAFFKEKVWIVSPPPLVEAESLQNWGEKTKNSFGVACDSRNKCFPEEHFLVFSLGVYSVTLMCQRVEVVLVEERQVNVSPNKAWVHFPAALPPGHRPLYIQVKSAFCLPKPCDLWPGSIDQTS